MVFNIYSLRTSISHKYIILIGLFYFRSTYADCLTDDPDNVLNVCSSSSRTSKIVHLYADKLRIPADFEGECSCDVTISANWRSIHLLYSSPASISCGIEFVVITYTFECGNVFGSYSIDKLFNSTIFRKTATIDGSACLSISIDHNFPSTNATVAVTCHAINAGKTTVSLSSSVSSEMTTTSSTMKFSTIKHQSTDTTQTVHISPSTKEHSLLTESSTRKVSPQTGDDDSSDSDQIGIIAGAVGGGGVVLIIAIILIACCWWKRQRNSKSTHDYVNSASDHEVTDNVVYNMEFPEDVKQPQISLNDMNATYNSSDNDAHHQENEKASAVPYTNFQFDDDGGNYNTVDLDKIHQERKTKMSVKYNNLQFGDDAGAYNTVDCDGTRDIQNETRKDSPLRPGLGADPSYDTLGSGQDTDTMNKTNSPAAEQNQILNVTYAVVNKKKPGDNTKDSDRPNQFQVAESGDTYAVVNKKSAK